MPGQGEQHKAAATSANPFEEVKPHINEYTAQEIATLSSRLEKQLGPEYISSRPGAGGGKVHYLSADKCINLANEVFGFNGWSSGIQNVQVDFVDENATTGKVSLGLSVIVRVTLRDGTYHEDVGYGHIENCKGKAPAFEKAKKEGTTDGLKRALRNFGNLLGNCVYDKDYVARVTKLKIAPTKWDPENLHRHPDFTPVKKEAATDGLVQELRLPQVKREIPMETEETQGTLRGDPEDEFGSDDFDEADFSVPHGEHPDEITLNPGVSSEQFRRRNSLPNKSHPSAARAGDNGNIPRLRSPLTRNKSTCSGPIQAPQTPLNNAKEEWAHPASVKNTECNSSQAPRLQHPIAPQQLESIPSISVQLSPLPRQPQPNNPAIATPTEEENCLHEPPIGFFTARAAQSLQNNPGLPLKAPAFNPHLESPSIRKTAGVDHSKTKPVGREAVGAPSPVAIVPPRSNFVNPQTDKTRRIGMPVVAASPLQNRSSYKPPQMKRPVPEGGGPRLALGDVTPASVNVPAGVGGESKRQRMATEEMMVSNDENMLNI